MKRHLLWCLGLSLVPVVLVVLWLAPETDPINSTNFNRIEVGMTAEQVQEILGRPDSDDIQEDISLLLTDENLEALRKKGSPEYWRGSGDQVITVSFRFRDETRVVVSKDFFNPGPWERLKAWWGGYELVSPLPPIRGSTIKLSGPAG